MTLARHAALLPGSGVEKMVLSHPMKKSKPKNNYHAPLRAGDTPQQTVGCRQANPEICNRHSMETVCAFVRTNGICLSPPASWLKQYAKLFVGNDAPLGG